MATIQARAETAPIRVGQFMNDNAVVLIEKICAFNRPWQIVLCWHQLQREFVVWSWNYRDGTAISGDYYPVYLPSALKKAIKRFDER